MQVETKIGESGNWPSAYTEFFACFNRGEFFRAHAVLESLWLEVRREAIGDFYKGLIQLAGAFVHVQKNRFQPAVALLDLAEKNLAKYPARFEELDLFDLRNRIARWKGFAAAGAIRQLASPRLPIVSSARAGPANR